jgi:hypothetical protein
MSLRGPVGDEAISNVLIIRGEIASPAKGGVAMTVISVFQSQS